MNCLVSLNGVELSDDTYVAPGTYVCYYDEKVNKWEDAAGGNHEDVYAMKVKGAFTFNSPSQAELDFFMRAYRLAKMSPDLMDKRIRMRVFMPAENSYKDIVANASAPRPVLAGFIGGEAFYHDIEFEFEEC